MASADKSSFERTMAELDSQIAKFELESKILKRSCLDHSTPKLSVQKTTDSGFETIRLSEFRIDEHQIPLYDDEENETKEEKIFKTPATKPKSKAEKTLDEKLDLRPYLLRETEQTPISIEKDEHRYGWKMHSDEYEPGITYRKRLTGHVKRENKAHDEPVYHSRAERKFETTDQIGSKQHMFGGSRPNIKPATYDGTSSWQDYKSHFDACAMLGNWSKLEKGLYLAVSLRGQAQGVLGNLSGDALNDYDELVGALSERFAPSNKTELYRAQLRERKKKATENLSELGQSIRRLTNLAYPTAPTDVRETLAKEQFLDALFDSDMRLRIKQARPRDLNEAIRHAIELEAYNKAEQRQIGNKGFYRPIGNDETPKDISELSKLIENMGKAMNDMRQDIKSIKKNKSQQRSYSNQKVQKLFQNNWKERATCHNCGRKGHLQRECKAPRRNKDGYAHKIKSQEKPNEHQQSSKQCVSKNPGKRDKKWKQKKNARIGINNRISDPGIYVEVSFNSIRAKMLVDTGATVSLISKELYNQIPVKEEELIPLTRDILSANGEPIEVYGKTVLNFHIGDRSYKNSVAVAKLYVDGVLGLDFMIENNCTIDLKNRRIWIGENDVQLIPSGVFGCYKIAEAYTLNAQRSQINTFGKIYLKEKDTTPQEIRLIEPDESFIELDKALIGKGLANVEHCIPVRIINLVSDVKLMEKGTEDLTLSPAQNVMGSTHDKNSKNVNKLNPEVDDLFERSNKNLTAKQKCPMCPYKTLDLEELKRHIVECGLRQLEKRFRCDLCNYASSKNANLIRHRKRHVQENKVCDSSDDDKMSGPSDVHEIIGNVSEDSGSSEFSSNDSDGEDIAEKRNETPREAGVVHEEKQRSSAEIQEELEVGRIVRKPRGPTPVHVPKRKAGDEKFQSALKKTVKSFRQFVPKPKVPKPYQMVEEVYKLGSPDIEIVPMREPPQVREMVHVGVQTSFSKRKVVWTTARWKEGDKDMELVEMVEEFEE